MPYDTTHSGVFDARFSDGKTAAAKDVRVTLSARGIIIHLPTGGSDLIWPYGALKTAPAAWLIAVCRSSIYRKPPPSRCAMRTAQ